MIHLSSLRPLLSASNGTLMLTGAAILVFAHFGELVIIALQWIGLALIIYPMIRIGRPYVASALVGDEAEPVEREPDTIQTAQIITIEGEILNARTLKPRRTQRPNCSDRGSLD